MLLAPDAKFPCSLYEALDGLSFRNHFVVALAVLRDDFLGCDLADEIGKGLSVRTEHLVLVHAVGKSDGKVGSRTYLGTKGATLISTTLKPCVPWTRNEVSTQVLASSFEPIRAVPHICHMLIAWVETYSYWILRQRFFVSVWKGRFVNQVRIQRAYPYLLIRPPLRTTRKLELIFSQCGRIQEVKSAANRLDSCTAIERVREELRV